MQLVKDIETLEMSNTSQNLQLLLDKKAELETLTQHKMKGVMVRTRISWLKDGEKPSKFFCNLENRHFVEKTMKQIKLSDGSVIHEQREVLRHIGKFYSKPLGNNDGNLDLENLNNILDGLKIPKVNFPDLGKPIKVNELGEVLKQCKHNKTPGMDGLTSEFLKVFWIKLK